MKIAIVGNGIIGFQTAARLLEADARVRLVIIGPSNRPGSATLAAAAMLNSFCEVESSTLEDPTERQRFLFNRSASPRWPGLLKDLERRSGVSLNYGFGTFLINNNAADKQESTNFDAVVQALTEFQEPYDAISPNEIRGYKPSAGFRAGRAIYLPAEGWVNPLLLMEALNHILQKSGRVEFIDGTCERVVLKPDEGVVGSVQLANGMKIEADQFILCPGANFTRLWENSHLGVELLKIYYGVGATVVLRTGSNTPSNCVRTPNRVAGCGVYGVPYDSQHTLIGATNVVMAEPVSHVQLSQIYSLVKSALEQINSDYAHSELDRINVGWRPTSADTLPMIGRTSISNLLVATGTKRDGLHCSPVISEYLTDLIIKGHSVHDLALFHPERKTEKVKIAPK